MKYDFIVVGAGIAGASIAYELAHVSRVCLIEAEDRPGLHSTGRSAALFAPSYGGREIRAVTRASRSFFDRPPVGFTDAPLLKARGCLYIAREDQQARLAQMAQNIKASGGDVSLIKPRRALELIPRLREAYVAGAALDRDAMDIDVDALHQAFLRGARTLGAILLTSHRLPDAERVGGVWRLKALGGVIEGPVLINAAGAWADEVAVSSGAPTVGLQPYRRTAMVIDPPIGTDVRQWPAVIDADEQFYFKPDAGRLLLSPADETPDRPGDAQPDEMDIAIGVDRVQAALDLEVRRINHSWAGLRTFAPDRVPVIGYDPAVDGFFWCAGQGGYGIQTAPAMARVAAALARGEPLPEDVASEGLFAEDLSPVRFAGAASTKAASPKPDWIKAP